MQDTQVRRAVPGGCLGRPLLGASFLKLLAFGSASSQVAPPTDTLTAHRIHEPTAQVVQLDGILSEAFWRVAPALTGLRQREPREGEAATQATEVRIAYDASALYIGVMAFDSEPDEIVARILQRDQLMSPDFFGGGLSFGGDDAVAVLLDPFHDHRNGVVFATNPNGAEFEALLTDEGSELNVDWRAVWEVAASRTLEGWSAEFAIPWRTPRCRSSAARA